MKHADFAVAVTAFKEQLLQTGFKTPEAVLMQELQQLSAKRDELLMTGLNEIRKGGHGPTWAKTILKLYGE